MERISIEEFKGLYTNVDESKQNPEFLRTLVDGRVRNGYIESEGYNTTLITLPQSLLHYQEVVLDEDRYANKIQDNKLVADYKQNLVTKNLYIYQSGDVHLDDFFVGTIQGNFIKLLNYDGIVQIFTDTNTYWVGKINRYIKASYGFIPPESKYYLYPHYDFFNYYPSFFTVELAEETIWNSVSATTIHIAGPFQPNLPNQRVITVGFYKEDGELIEQLRFGGELFNDEIWIYPAGPPNVGNFLDTAHFLANYRRKDLIAFIPGGLVKLSQFVTIKMEHKEVKYPTITGSFVEIVQTIVYGQNELVVSHNKKTITQGCLLKFQIDDLSIFEPGNPEMNKRVNVTKFYIRTKKNDDFELIHTFDLTFGGEEKFTFTVNELDRQGVYLVQSIGALYNEKTYKPVTVFSDYIRIGSTPFGISGRQVYYSAIASGAITDLFYDTIPNVEGDFLLNVTGDLGVGYSDRDMLKLISIQDSGEGFLLFAEKMNLSFSLSHKRSFIQTPEGVAILTKQGIYVLNGYERQIISEPINDLIEECYPNVDIYYDFTDQTLFVRTWNQWTNKVRILQYEFVYNIWRELNLYADEFYLTKDPYIRISDKLYKLFRTTNVITSISTPGLDLDMPTVMKNMLYIVFDVEGTVYVEGAIAQSIGRQSLRLGIGVSNRVPSTQLKTFFGFKGKLYKIELYYALVGEQNANHFYVSKTTA